MNLRGEERKLEKEEGKNKQIAENYNHPKTLLNFCSRPKSIHPSCIYFRSQRRSLQLIKLSSKSVLQPHSIMHRIAAILAEGELDILIQILSTAPVLEEHWEMEK